jgi:tetratricopeptide (TPR) repeat protein
MPKELRSELHERFADWLERSRSGFDEIVGFHLEQAYRLREQLGRLGEDAQAIAQRAGERLGSAGQRALDRGDGPAAVTLLERATDLLLPDFELRRRLLIDLAYALIDGGKLDDAKKALDEAEAAAERAGDTAVAARARVGLAQRESRYATTLEGDLLEEVTTAIRTLDELGDDAGLAEGWTTLATFRSWIGASEQAADAYERAAEHARRAGNRGLERNAVATRTIQEAWGHLPADEGLRICDELLEQEKGTFVEPLALGARALYGAWQGDFDRARSDIRRGRALLRDFGNELLANASSMVEAIVELEAGNAVYAEATAREGYEALANAGEMGFRSTIACILAEALYEQERYDEAERLAIEGGDLAAGDDYVSQCRSRAIRARLLARRGEHASAQALAREALAIVARTDAYGEHAEVLVHHAEVSRLTGRNDDARAALEQAIELFERKGSSFRARQARTVLRAL